MPGNFRSGYVAILGWPNVGKSSLLNAFLETKLSIVTPKPQTTRESILGIVNDSSYQMVFVDTPGWLEPKDLLQTFMKKSIMRSLHDDADLVLWLLEPKDVTPAEIEFAGKIGRIEKPVVVAVNKIDTVSDRSVVSRIEAACRPLLPNLEHVRPISAKTGEGVSDLKNILSQRLPEGSPYYSTDQITDRWERFYVAELIREQVFERTRDEVPHATAVVVEEFKENVGQKDHIQVALYVETEGQKRILIGDKGSMIRVLGTAARKEIEERLGRPIFLEMTVKVKKNWRKDVDFLKSLM